MSFPATLKGLNNNNQSFINPNQQLTMSTYTQILYQIVFSTKERKKVLQRENRPELFKYIYGILKKKNCHLYRVNGIEDHIHILTSLHPAISLSSLVKDIKVASSGYIKEKGLFSGFNHWQEGYGAFTYSIKEKDRLIEYVKNQEEHHKKITFRHEFKAMLNEHDIKFDEKFLI
jgi:putative transposase